MAIAPAKTSAAIDDVPGPVAGRRCLDSLRDGREVWIDGARVEDVTRTRPSGT
jgi:hypothetical protein